MKYKVSVGVIATDPPVKQGDVIDGSILGDALNWHVESGNVIALGDGSESEPKDDGGETEKPVSKMNKAELLSFAESKGIEIPEGSTNDQIRELIAAATV